MGAGCRGSNNPAAIEANGSWSSHTVDLGLTPFDQFRFKLCTAITVDRRDIKSAAPHQLPSSDLLRDVPLRRLLCRLCWDVRLNSLNARQFKRQARFHQGAPSALSQALIAQ